MDSILIILKKCPKGFISPKLLGPFSIIFKHVFGIYSRSQVSVYMTIDPLVMTLHNHLNLRLC